MYGHAHERIRSLHATLFLSLRCNGKYLAFGRAVATSPFWKERKTKPFQITRRSVQMATKNTDGLTPKRKCPVVNPLQAL